MLKISFKLKLGLGASDIWSTQAPRGEILSEKLLFKF